MRQELGQLMPRAHPILLGRLQLPDKIARNASESSSGTHSPSISGTGTSAKASASRWSGCLHTVSGFFGTSVGAITAHFMPN